MSLAASSSWTCSHGTEFKDCFLSSNNVVSSPNSGHVSTSFQKFWVSSGMELLTCKSDMVASKDSWTSLETPCLWGFTAANFTASSKVWTSNHLWDRGKSGRNKLALTAMKMASICLRTGAAASREYSKALLSPGAMWYPANLRSAMSTFAFDIQESTVAFDEWVATSLRFSGDHGCNSSRIHTLASEEDKGCRVQPPPVVGAGIVGSCIEALRPISDRFRSQWTAQSQPETPGNTPATGKRRTILVRLFWAVLWW